MYPNAKIPGNGGSAGADWSAKARAAGFTGTKPQGATDIQSNNDGTFTITINGTPTKCNPDGSIFTPNNNNGNNNGNGAGNGNSGVSGAGNGGNDNGNNGASGAGNGNGNGNGTIFNYSTVNGGYSIDQNIFMNAAMNLDATVGIGSEIPYGLGGLFAQNNIAQAMQQFMNSVSFNFDLSNIQTSQTLQLPSLSVDGFNLPTITVPGTTPAGETTVTDENGNQKTVDQLAEEGGYTKTETTGVYKKGSKYYKYDTSQKKFVELTGDALKAAKKADEDAALKEKKAKKLEEIKKKNQENAKKGDDIAGKIYKAVKGSGTDDAALTKAIDKINADNVMAVFDAWTKDSTYAKNFGEDDIIGAIQDDCSGSQQTGYEKKIKQALYDRSNKIVKDLQEYGLDDEATDLQRAANEFKNTVESEHNSWHSSDSTVKSAFDSFVPKLRAAEKKLKETLTPAS